MWSGARTSLNRIICKLSLTGGAPGLFQYCEGQTARDFWKHFLGPKLRNCPIMRISVVRLWYFLTGDGEARITVENWWDEIRKVLFSQNIQARSRQDSVRTASDATLHSVKFSGGWWWPHWCTNIQCGAKQKLVTKPGARTLTSTEWSKYYDHRGNINTTCRAHYKARTYKTWFILDK